MADVQDSQENDHDEEVAASLRSRASSMISTGTKFSTLTFPPENASQHNIDGVISGSSTATDGPTAAPRLVPRPMSIYSFRSMGEALPAYSETQYQSSALTTDPAHPARPSHDNHHEHDFRPTAADNDATTTINDDDDDDTTTTPTSIPDPENALSMHYGRIVRTIDDNHARLLARMQSAHEAELAALRNNIDAAYRQELKGRNREVERIREEAAGRERELEVEVERLRGDMVRVREEGEGEVERVRGEAEEGVERRCARARHVVEDLWEERWVRRNEVSVAEERRRERSWEGRVRGVVEGWEGAVREAFGGEGLERVRGVVRTRGGRVVEWDVGEGSGEVERKEG